MDMQHRILAPTIRLGTHPYRSPERGSILLSTATAAYAEGEPKLLTPDKIEFKSRLGSPPNAVLYGNPANAGLYVQRVKLAEGENIVPHTHPDDRTVVVLQGTMYVGFGEEMDESKLVALSAGSFFTEPAKVPHYNVAKDDDVIVQVTGTGPSAPVPLKK